MRQVDKLKKTAKILTISDAYVLAMLVIYALLCVIFWAELKTPAIYLTSYVLVSVAVIAFAYLSHKYQDSKSIKLARRIYYIPIVYFIYSNVHHFIPIVNPHDYDNVLIAWDYAIFGVHPTVWLDQFATPILTEYLQFCYMMFYIIPFVIGIEFTLRHQDEKFYEYVRMIVFGFFFSYLLYFFMPAIGPRFTLHDFSLLNQELPGLYLTNIFREMVNAGGGILPTTINPANIVNRDCMPSGHTMMTCLSIYLAFKFSSKFKWIVAIIGVSLIIGTVYLRYHYVVDLIAGTIFAAITLWIEPKFNSFLQKQGFQKQS